MKKPMRAKIVNAKIARFFKDSHVCKTVPHLETWKAHDGTWYVASPNAGLIQETAALAATLFITELDFLYIIMSI